MNDYLSILVAKNLSPHESIHPRPSSRFEPSPHPSVNSATGEIAQEDESQSLLSPDAETIASPPQLGQLTAQAKSSQFLDSLTPSSQTAETQSSEAKAPASTRPGPSTDQLATSPYRGRLDPPSNPSSPAHPAPQPSTSQLEKAKAPPENPQQQPLTPKQEPDSLARLHNRIPESRPEVQEKFIERIIERTLVPVDNPGEHLNQSERAAPVLPIAPTSQVPQPASRQTSLPEGTVAHPLRPVVPPLPDLNARYTSQQPEPIVNVTIGRVEIRAASPTPPPRKPERQPGIMSLDDYLRSRTDRDRP